MFKPLYGLAQLSLIKAANEAASFISNRTCDVAYWHVASFGATHHFWSLLE
jgi:hypothetical protein